MVEQAYKICKHFDSEFADYDFCADKVVPRNLELQRALVAAIPLNKRARLRMLDLGAGTGHTSLLALQAFPNATIEGIDLSDSMLAIARRRLSRHDSRVKLRQGDFCATELGSGFDVVFSAVSIHNCLDENKRILFKKVGEALRNGGVFVNADFVKFSSRDAQEAAQARYLDCLRHNLGGKELDHWSRHVLSEDKPAALDEQFSWLKENAFAEPEVTYSFENTVVYRAFK